MTIMGNPINRTITQTGTGTTDWVPLNRYAGDDVSLAAFVDGTATYTVEMTLERVNREEYDPATVRVLDHGTLVGSTGSASGNIDFPVEAIRLNVTAGTGSVELQIYQGSS